MEHFWRTTSLHQELSSRLDGVSSASSEYKYNSVLVLNKQTDNDVVYVFPRHKPGQWISDMKGMFLTVVSMADGLLENEAGTTPSKDKKESFKKIDKQMEGSFKKDTKRIDVNYKVYKVKLHIHGGPVHCSIVSFPDYIFVVSSDSCSDAEMSAVYFHDIIPSFIPDSHNSILYTTTETTRVVDSYVASALEVVGTVENITLPTHHRGHVTSRELQDALLDIEVKLEMTEDVCVTCGGLVVVSYPNIVYSSLPPEIQSTVLQTLFFRELTAVSQGYVIWFNKLYKHPFKVKQQGWYLLTVSKNNISTSQLLGIFGKPDKELIIRAARDLENLLELHNTEIKQHLPCQAILLKHCQVLGYKYGESRVFFSESRFQGIVEFYHAHDDCGFSSAGRFVLQLEGDMHVAQRVIASKVFTVVYESKGVHDIDTVFCELGI